MKKLFNTKLAILLIAVCAVLLTSGLSFAQEEREDDPTSWKYFRINARSQDDSIFVVLQQEMGISPLYESYPLIVNTLDVNASNHYLQIGEEGNPDAVRTSWTTISEGVRSGLLKWNKNNKEWLNRKKLNYGSVFLDAIKKIKIKDVISPPEKIRDIKNTTAYINPYLQAFGGDPLGIPLKKGFGLSMYLGTPYSGPLETDKIGGNFHLLGASVGVSTRIKEFVIKHEAGATAKDADNSFGNYNNLFTPKLALEVNYTIPFGNFFSVGYYTSLDSGDYDPPLKIINKAVTDSIAYMPNNVIVKENFFNWEFRYPFRTFGSTRAKVYIARYLGETHIGFVGREMRVAGSVFDVRINATLKGRRNFQLLMETMFADIAEGFGQTALAFGPSIRLTTTPSGSFGVVCVLLNMRLKIGDFYDADR